MAAAIRDLPELRDRGGVFRDRADAGRALAELLAGYRDGDAAIVAIPAGGVPVAVEVARRLGLPLEVAPVSKILLPWTTEAGFGAVAFDGTCWLDGEAMRQHGLTPAQVETARRAASEKVARRAGRFRAADLGRRVEGRTAILVDDGIAAGSTMRAALAAMRRLAAAKVAIAVPTGHAASVGALAELADEVFCANLRHGYRFAVADAYEEWSDVSEDEAAALADAYRTSAA